MADQGGGLPRCAVCGAEPHPGAAFCMICGNAVGAVTQEVTPPDPPGLAAPAPVTPPAPQAPVPPAPPVWWAPPPAGPRAHPKGGRASGASPTAARGWGAASLAFGVLVLIGSAVPWYADSSFAATDDMSSAWPLLVIGLVGVLGGIDGLRGSLLGPAVAAGVGSVFVLLQVVLIRVANEFPGVEMGGGGVAWTLAALAAAVLVIAVLSLVRADRAEGTAPGWLSAVVLVAGAVWLAGMIWPATPGVSLSDHVEYVLFGGDAFFDVVTAALIVIPAALVVLAAATRSRAAYGLAAGSMVFWTLAAVTSAAGYGASGDGTVRYAFGPFWPMLLGALGVAIAGCVAMLLPHGVEAFAPRFPLAPAVGLALLPIAGIVGAVQYAEGHDAFGVDAAYGSYGTYDESSEYEAETEPADDPYVAPSTDEGDSGGSVDVVCTDLVDSTVQSAWQDVDGAIHVIVLLDNNCESGQQLDDASASFTLTSSGATVADASFDFSSRPVVVPASGTSEVGIVFGPDTFVDLEAVETLGLTGTGTTGGAGSLGLSYRYTCTGAPDGSAPSSGGEVAGVATASPIVPQTTTEGEALARLEEIAQADAPFVESDVLDRWVPQISSKKPNVTLSDGTVWDAVSILEDHRGWREQFPRVRLLWSGDYSTFELTDYWVTIVAVPFDTAEGALAWCDAQALPGEDCYAKLISHTHPHDDSTRLR
jgi:hypothetical protein